LHGRGDSQGAMYAAEIVIREVQGDRGFQVRQRRSWIHPVLFRDTMLKLLSSDNLEYKELTAKAA